MQGMGFWTRPLAFLERCRARYGKRFTLRIPISPPFVIVTDPDDVKQVFTAPPEVLHPGQGAKVLEPIVGGNSVLLLDEDAHMSQRKLMLPAFHGERMQRYGELMADIAAREIATWPAGEQQHRHARMHVEQAVRHPRAVADLLDEARIERWKIHPAAMRERVPSINRRRR